MALSLLLAGALFLGYWLAGFLRRTDEFRSGPPGVSDVLNWITLIHPGVVLLKDGAFLAGWRYRGPDASAATAEDLNTLSKHVNDGLLPYTDGWMLHVDAVRRRAAGYAPPAAFPDAVTALVDWERRQAYEEADGRYETEFLLTVTFAPEEGRSSWWRRIVMQGDEHTLRWESHLIAFLNAIGRLEDRLDARLQMERLSSSELLTHLHRCLYGIEHPVLPPPQGEDLDVVLCDQRIVTGNEPVLAPGTPAERHLRVVAVEGYPGDSWMGILDTVGQLPAEYRWSNRFIPLGPERAAKVIRTRQRQWFKKRRGAGDFLRDMRSEVKTAADEKREELFQDAHAIQMTQGSGKALAECSSGAIRFGYFNSNFVIYGPSPEGADRMAAQLAKAVQDRGFSARVETINSFDAFIGSLPGHGYQNVRRAFISSRNVTDLLPLTAVWAGDAWCPSPFFPVGSPALMWTDTEGSTPFRLNLHVQDVGHTLIVGATGAGKSTLLSMLAMQARRYRGAQVFLLDNGFSAEVLTRAARGQHYDIRPSDDRLQFQPLAHVDQPDERAWAADWLETLLELAGLPVTPAIREAADHALRRLAEMDPPLRTLSQFVIQVQDAGVKQALHAYEGTGSWGRLLDGDEDGFSTGSFHTFELGMVLELGDKISVPVVLYLLHRIETMLDASRPSFILIDEASKAILHRVFETRIADWLVRLRKKNTALVLVVQNVEQIAQSRIRDTILTSCVTRIILPEPQATDPQIAVMYASIGLNSREIARVGEGRKKRDYYYQNVDPRRSRMFEMRLGPAALSFLGSRPGMTPYETRERARGMERQLGARWPGEWLRECGLHEAAAQFDQLNGEPNDSEREAA